MAEDEELPESVESVEPQDVGERTPDTNEQVPEGVEDIEPENSTEETPDINEQLLTAAKDGEVDEIKRCLAEGADINTRSSIGMTPLYRAVFWNRDDVVAYLLTEAKPNLEIEDDDGESPLWRAVAEQNENNVKILLENGADVNVTDSQGVSALFRAVDENATSIVRLVLGGNPDVNAKNGSRETPLLHACTNGSDEIAELLIQAGAKIGAFDNEGDSELCQAAYRGNSELAKLLLRHGADIGSANEVGMTPFLWAAERGNVEVGQLLLDAGADIGAVENDGYTALHWCASFGHAEFAEMLLKNNNQASGADELLGAPSAPGAGSVETRPKVPPKLLLTKLDIEAKNKVGETALHVASANGRTEIVTLLMGRANFAARDGLEWTALHHGAYYGQTETVQLLLTKIKPATLTAKNVDGNTVLHFASRSGKDDLVNVLLKEFENVSQGAYRNTITEKNYDGQTALSIATDEAQKDTVQLLVNAEADVFYVASEDGSTAQSWPKMERTSPKQVEATSSLLMANEEQWKDIGESVKQTLHWACRTGDRDLVKKILELPGVEDKDVLYWAAVGGQTKIVQFLLDKYTKDNPDAIKSGKLGPRAVLEAARNGQGLVVQQILRSMMELSDVKFETDTSEAATETWLPLHWAVNYKAREPEQAVEVVRHLLMNGANPEAIIDADGRTPDSAMELARRLKDSPEFKGEFKTAIVSLLETPLRLPRKPLQLVEPTLGPGGVQNVCKQFSANIIDFYPSPGRFDTLERKTSVYDIIYKEGPHSMMSDARENWNIKLQHRFRWIHLPANNWIWVEDLMRRLSYESGQPDDEYTRLQNFVEQNRREHLGKTQYRFMYPALTFESKDFQSGEGANITKLQSQAKKEELSRTQKLKTSGKTQDTTTPTQKGDALKGLAGETTKLNEKAQNSAGDSKDRANEDVRLGEAKADPSRVDEKSKDKKDIKPPDHGPPDAEQHPSEDKSKLEKQRIDQKETSLDEEKEIPHLEGCKLAVSIPFLTFQSVKSHRKLRQAIRLAEEVHHLSDPVDKPHEDAVSQEKIEPARIRMLEREVRDGKILLKKAVEDYDKKKSVSSTHTKLHELHEMVEAAEQKTHAKLKEELDLLRKSLKEIKKRNLTAELLEWYERFDDALDILEHTKKTKDIASKHEALLQQYLRPDQAKGLHASRTLDQYYYSSLADTSRRDIDQVVRRYQLRAKAREEQQKNKNEGKNERGGGSEPTVEDSNFQMGMVDQLWLWVIDDKTVITCFPQSIDRNANNRAELLDKIRSHIHEDSRPEISSIYHLATIIMSLCVGFVEDCQAQLPGGPESFLHMFASSIGIVADEEVKCFEAFRRELGKRGKAKDISSTIRELDLQNEITLLEEVKDIRDELNILQSICEDQKDLLQKLSGLIAKPQGAAQQEIEKDPILNYYKERSDIDLRIDKIRKLQTDATTTYDSLNHLLDLKQKNANISEAVESRKQAVQTRIQAEETTKQGRTIMVFTIVTIIFLPMSFLTSFFALNVDSFPHQDGSLSYPGSWVFSRIFGITAALGIPLVLVAFYINSFLNMFKSPPPQELHQNPHTSALSPLHTVDSDLSRPISKGDGWEMAQSRPGWPRPKFFVREKSLSSPESLQEEGKASEKVRASEIDEGTSNSIGK